MWQPAARRCNPLQVVAGAGFVFRTSLIPLTFRCDDGDHLAPASQGTCAGRGVRARARGVSPNLDLRAAARLVAALRAPPALAATDIVMPDLDGVELLNPLRGPGYRTDRPKRCSCC